MITLELVNAMAGSEEWYEPLRDACNAFEIDTDARISMFLSQCAHESQGFATLEENLNYSEARLPVVFPKYFTAAQAKQYARKPEKIASRVYASRMGNGNEASGDGWKYRGRGLIQLTGRNNYLRCGTGLGVDLIETPDLLTYPVYAAHSAAWFWDDIDGNTFADVGDFVGLTRRINGGTIGIDDRLAWLDKVKGLMA